VEISSGFAAPGPVRRSTRTSWPSAHSRHYDFGTVGSGDASIPGLELTSSSGTDGFLALKSLTLWLCVSRDLLQMFWLADEPKPIDGELWFS